MSPSPDLPDLPQRLGGTKIGGPLEKCHAWLGTLGAQDALTFCRGRNRGAWGESWHRTVLEG